MGDRPKAIPVHVVRDWGQRTGNRRVIVLAISGGNYSITTWGATRADCRLLAEWAESDSAPAVIGQIHDEIDDYLDARADSEDGSYGIPEANEAMRQRDRLREARREMEKE